AACPEGITRQTIIDLCDENDIPCIERDLSMTHVYNADECFTTGTMGELAWVGKIDGRVIGDGAMGAMTKRLSELFVELTKREGVRVV
ncbi:MAG TPA: aminotransferase IV, partial [Phycisphaerales bacterium]|nr:aminotransferase IV [Phycisphaerales bacterium]